MVSCLFVYYNTHLCVVVVVCENPWWLLSNHLVLNLFCFVTYTVTAYIQTCHGVWPVCWLMWVLGNLLTKKSHVQVCWLTWVSGDLLTKKSHACLVILVCITTSLGVLWHLVALGKYLELPTLYRNLVVPMWHLLLSIWLGIPSHFSPFMS